MPDKQLRIGQVIRKVRSLDPQFDASLPSVLKQWDTTRMYKGVAIDNPAEVVVTYALDKGIPIDKLHGFGKDTVIAAAENIAYIRHSDATVPLHLMSYWPLSDPVYIKARKCMEDLKQDPTFYKDWLDVLQEWDSTGLFLGVKVTTALELFAMYALSVGTPVPKLADLGRQTVASAVEKLYLANNPSLWESVPWGFFLGTCVGLVALAGLCWFAIYAKDCFSSSLIPTPPPLPPVYLSETLNTPEAVDAPWWDGVVGMAFDALSFGAPYLIFSIILFYLQKRSAYFSSLVSKWKT